MKFACRIMSCVRRIWNILMGKTVSPVKIDRIVHKVWSSEDMHGTNRALLRRIADFDSAPLVKIISEHLLNEKCTSPWLMDLYQRMIVTDLTKYDDQVLEKVATALYAVYKRKSYTFCFPYEESDRGYLEQLGSTSVLPSPVTQEIQFRNVSSLLEHADHKTSPKMWSVLYWIVQLEGGTCVYSDACKAVHKLLCSSTMHHPAVCYAACILGIISLYERGSRLILPPGLKADIFTCPDDFPDAFIKDRWTDLIRGAFTFQYRSTSDWLHDSLEMVVDVPVHNGWIAIAGFRRCGCIFTVYKDVAGTRYCAHAGEEWEKDEEPLYGYFPIELTWDELVDRIAARYDAKRSKITVIFTECNTAMG